MFSSPSHDWIEQAILYASLNGWSLIPLVPRRKVRSGQTGMSAPEPRFETWQEEYAADEPTIRAWGDVVEPSDIGLVTGQPSGVIALEIRVDAGGQDALEELAGEDRILPQTVCFSDYNRDAWLLFAHPGFPLASIEIADGLFLHGEESIVRLPESQYLRASGGLCWDSAPGLEAVAELPDWFWQAAGIDVRSSPAQRASGSGEGVRLPFVRAADVQKAPAHEWVARPWAATGSLTLLIGTAKRAGKSTWLRHLAGQVLGGEAFLEEPTLRSPVVYLTEESPAVFGRALERLGLDDGRAADLHILHHADTREMAWDEIMAASCEQCLASGAQLVILDTINRFAGVRSVDGLSVDGVQALERLLDEGVAVVAALQHPDVTDGPSEKVLQAFGPLASLSDTICHLRPLPRGNPRHRRLDVWSRFPEATGQFLSLEAEGYRKVGAAGPEYGGANGEATPGRQLRLTH